MGDQSPGGGRSIPRRWAINPPAVRGQSPGGGRSIPRRWAINPPAVRGQSPGGGRSISRRLPAGPKGGCPQSKATGAHPRHQRAVVWQAPAGDGARHTFAWVNLPWTMWTLGARPLSSPKAWGTWALRKRTTSAFKTSCPTSGLKCPIHSASVAGAVMAQGRLGGADRFSASSSEDQRGSARTCLSSRHGLGVLDKGAGTVTQGRGWDALDGEVTPPPPGPPAYAQPLSP